MAAAAAAGSEDVLATWCDNRLSAGRYTTIRPSTSSPAVSPCRRRRRLPVCAWDRSRPACRSGLRSARTAARTSRRRWRPAARWASHRSQQKNGPAPAESPSPEVVRRRRSLIDLQFLAGLRRPPFDIDRPQPTDDVNGSAETPPRALTPGSRNLSPTCRKNSIALRGSETGGRLRQAASRSRYRSKPRRHALELDETDQQSGAGEASARMPSETTRRLRNRRRELPRPPSPWVFLPQP